MLADVDVTTGLLDPEAVEAVLTPRTVAVAAVHLYGQPVDADRFGALARRHGLFLLEDAAQAIGAAWHNRPAGSLGDAAGFSFYPGKNLGALGDGGAVTTADAALARRVRLLRSHGEEGKGVHVVAGFCERLDELQAAFLLAKLPHLPAAQAARQRAVDRYRRRLAELQSVQVLETTPGAGHAHHLFVVRVPRRDAVLASLHAAGWGHRCTTARRSTSSPPAGTSVTGVSSPSPRPLPTRFCPCPCTRESVRPPSTVALTLWRPLSAR